MTILSACAKTNYKACISNIHLPDMPLAGNKVADELKSLCSLNKCHNLNNYFNEIYLFREQYLIYQEALLKP